MHDSVFQALVALASKDSADTPAFCLSCHSNVGTAARGLQAESGFDSYAPVVMEGVTCESCHRMTDVLRPFNAGHVLDPKAPMQGTVRAGDASPYHDTQRSATLGSAESCASCHDVQTPAGVVLEQPYREWNVAPAKDDGLVCVDCHMPKVYGEAAKDFGLQARPLRRHVFLGPGLLTRAAALDSSTNRALAAEVKAQLQRSVALELPPVQALCAAPLGRIGVTVSSRVTGHRFPTGSAFFRELQLHLRVVDGAGKLIYQTGEGGAPPPEAMSALLFDERGERTLFPWRAARVTNLALEPLERRSLELTFALPKELQWPLTAAVSLRFRTFPARLLEDLELDPSVAADVELDTQTARIELLECKESAPLGLCPEGSAAEAGGRRFRSVPLADGSPFKVPGG
jgi:hypothetical protein